MQVLVDAKISRDISIEELYTWLSSAPVQFGFQAITLPIIGRHNEMLIGQILLAESHINVHLVLNLHRAFIDIFTCGLLREAAVQAVIKDLPLSEIRYNFIERGIEYNEVHIQVSEGILLGSSPYST